MITMVLYLVPTQSTQCLLGVYSVSTKWLVTVYSVSTQPQYLLSLSVYSISVYSVSVSTQSLCLQHQCLLSFSVYSVSVSTQCQCLLSLSIYIYSVLVSTQCISLTSSAAVHGKDHNVALLSVSVYSIYSLSTKYLLSVYSASVFTQSQFLFSVCSVSVSTQCQSLTCWAAAHRDDHWSLSTQSTQCHTWYFSRTSRTPSV